MRMHSKGCMSPRWLRAARCSEHSRCTNPNPNPNLNPNLNPNPNPNPN